MGLLRVPLALLLVVTIGAAAGARTPVSGAAVAGLPLGAASIDAVGGLEPLAQERWPESFAGIWAERGAGGERVVAVAFTQGAESKTALLAGSFSRPELLEPVTVPRSLSELERRQRQMAADRERAAAGELVLRGVPGGRYNLGISVKRNAIYVMLDEVTRRAVRSFEGRYGDDLRFRQADVGGPEGCGRRSACKPRLRAGLRMTSRNSWCSSAFAVRTAQGDRQLLSAAHCRHPERMHAGVWYGAVQAQKRRGRVDAERHGVILRRFAALPRLYANKAYQAVPVYGMTTWRRMVVGSSACKSGVRTGQSCGRIVDKHFMPYWVRNGNRFIRARYCADGGDSGAAIYKRSNWTRAYGIHSGGTNPSGADRDDHDCRSRFRRSEWSAFGHLQYALRALDVSLLTAR